MAIVIYMAGMVSGIVLLGVLVGFGFRGKEDEENGKVGTN